VAGLHGQRLDRTDDVESYGDKGDAENGRETEFRAQMHLQGVQHGQGERHY